MSEYIEREKLIDQLLPLADASAKLHDGIMTAIFQVKNQPAADVPSVVHGHWEVFAPWGSKKTVICSECGNYSPLAGEYAYCPNCGARMDKEENDNV